MKPTLGGHMAIRLLGDLTHLTKTGAVYLRREGDRWKVAGAELSTFVFASPIPYQVLQELYALGGIENLPKPGAKTCRVRLTEAAKAKLAAEALGPDPSRTVTESLRDVGKKRL